MRTAAALVLCLLASAAHADRAPRATSRGGRLLLALPAATLEARAIREQLGSGLTTAFVLRVRGVDSAGHDLSGGARIEIRFELWNERYILNVLDISGRREQLIRNSWKELAEWWTGHDHFVLQLHPEPEQPPRALQTRLEVLPFSAREENDARKWLMQSPKESASGEAGPGVTRSILDMVIGTSLQSRPIAAYRWNVAVQKAAP